MSFENAKDVLGFENLYKVDSEGVIYSSWSSKYPIKKAQVGKNGYLYVLLWVKSKPVKRYVHRLLWEAFNGIISKELQIDHIDGNRQNNKFSNLRLASPHQNSCNHKIRPGREYKGVHQENRSKRWISSIGVDNTTKYLGSYDSAMQAAVAYDLAAIKHYGEFANTNLIKTASRLALEHSWH